MFGPYYPLDNCLKKTHEASYNFTQYFFWKLRSYASDNNMEVDSIGGSPSVELITPVSVRVFDSKPDGKIYNLNVTNVALFLEGFQFIDKATGYRFRTDNVLDCLGNYLHNCPHMLVGDEMIPARIMSMDVARVAFILDQTINPTMALFRTCGKEKRVLRKGTLEVYDRILKDYAHKSYAIPDQKKSRGPIRFNTKNGIVAFCTDSIRLEDNSIQVGDLDAGGSTLVITRNGDIIQGKCTIKVNLCSNALPTYYDYDIDVILATVIDIESFVRG